jgi:hypothetical protein
VDKVNLWFFMSFFDIFFITLFSQQQFSWSRNIDPVNIDQSFSRIRESEDRGKLLGKKYGTQEPISQKYKLVSKFFEKNVQYFWV